MTRVRPQPSVPRPYHFPNEERRTYENGLTVIVAPSRRVPLVTLLATVDAGGEVDTIETAGAASLAAKAMAEGAGSRSADQLADAFADLGGNLHAGAGWSKSELETTVIASCVQEALALMASVLMAPTLPSDAIGRLRDERLAELTQLEAEPRNLADDAFAATIFSSTSRYSVPVDGDRRGVSATDGEAVRGVVRTRYTPSNTRLVVVGDVQPEAMFSLVERLFGAWRGVVASAVTGHGHASEQPRRLRIVHRAGAEQTELRIGHVSVARRHPDYFPLLVMNAVLGGLFNSRINLNLRERHGFTYGAFSSLTLLRFGGAFEVSTAVRSDVTVAAAQEILNEITRIRDDAVTESERALAVDYLAQVFPIRFESTSAIADAIAARESLGLEPGYYGSYRDKVLAVSTDDIQRVAVEHLNPTALRAAIVGDATAHRTALEGLFGEAEITDLVSEGN